MTVPLGPRTPYTGAVGPVEIKPTATLACPIVSALDRWLATRCSRPRGAGSACR